MIDEIIINQLAIDNHYTVPKRLIYKQIKELLSVFKLKKISDFCYIYNIDKEYFIFYLTSQLIKKKLITELIKTVGQDIFDKKNFYFRPIIYKNHNFNNMNQLKSNILYEEANYYLNDEMKKNYILKKENKSIYYIYRYINSIKVQIFINIIK